MDVWLLWGTVVLLLLGAVVILVLERRKHPGENKVILLFLENGEEVCEAILRRICFRARQNEGGARVVVIDNGSRDETVRIVRRMTSMFPEIELIDRKETLLMDPAWVKAMLQKKCTVVDFRDFPVYSNSLIAS